MVSPIIWLLAGMAAPKFYEKYADPEEKKAWKTAVGMHHGEAGVLMLLGGVAISNLGLASFGAGLAIEDWKDRKYWFNKANTE